MSTKTDQRAKKILQVLLRHGNISVDELADFLSASAASVRRDLTRLEQRGLVHRTHGGAQLAGQIEYEPFRFDSSFQEREGRFAEEKRRIAMAAAELIREHETVGFTAGTTTTQVARCIRHRTGIHVITNAVNIGMELSNQAALSVTLTGGTMRWAGAFSLTGPAAMETLSGVFLDKAFIGACGVDVLRFLDEADPRGFGLSTLAYNFIGGLKAHARAYIGVTASTVNSYKRLKESAMTQSGATWSPVYVTYGYNNRTQMLRVPGPGRVEDRTIDGGCNPYLAATVILAAGLDGVERSLEAGEPNATGALTAGALFRIARRCHTYHAPNPMAAISIAIRIPVTNGPRLFSSIGSRIEGLRTEVFRVTAFRNDDPALAGASPVANVYSASSASSSSPRWCATDLTNPRLNTPPGNWLHCSFSIASRKRVPIRVADAISSSEIPRISRSRFR